MLPLSAFAGDISFDPGITQEEFRKFSSLVGQAIYATPVDGATGKGLFNFDIGVSAVAVPIDERAAYWVRSVDSDFSTSGYVAVPRIVVAKGFGAGAVTANYAEIPDSDIKMYGGTLDITLLGGNVVSPTLSVRGSYGTLDGIEELDLDSYGVELFLSKGFGPFTPYIGAGVARTASEGIVNTPVGFPQILLEDEIDNERITVGVRLSLLVPKLVVEATQSEELSYAAKVSFGF